MGSHSLGRTISTSAMTDNPNKSMQNKITPTEGESSDQTTDESSLDGAACSPRFILEERSGIVAIYDTHHPDYEVTAGCHSDYPWVVCSWGGSPVYSDTGSIAYWEVEPRWIVKAKQTLDLLNSLENDQGDS